MSPARRAGGSGLHVPLRFPPSVLMRVPNLGGNITSAPPPQCMDSGGSSLELGEAADNVTEKQGLESQRLGAGGRGGEIPASPPAA